MGHGSASTAGGGGRSPGNPSFPPEYLHQNVYPDLSSDESKYKADTRQHWFLYIIATAVECCGMITVPLPSFWKQRRLGFCRTVGPRIAKMHSDA